MKRLLAKRIAWNHTNLRNESEICFRPSFSRRMKISKRYSFSCRDKKIFSINEKKKRKDILCDYDVFQGVIKTRVVQIKVRLIVCDKGFEERWRSGIISVLLCSRSRVRSRFCHNRVVLTENQSYLR